MYEWNGCIHIYIIEHRWCHIIKLCINHACKMTNSTKTRNNELKEEENIWMQEKILKFWNECKMQVWVNL